MYQRGKPFVGARVWIDSEIHYDVVAVTPTTYNWKSSITKNIFIADNMTFLQDGEKPYYTVTDCLKALKNEISKGIPRDQGVQVEEEG